MKPRTAARVSLLVYLSGQDKIKPPTGSGRRERISIHHDELIIGVDFFFSVQIFFNIEGVFGVAVRGQLVVGVLGSQYKTWDADYSITDEQLSKLCTLHNNTIKSNNTNNNSVTKPTTTSTSKETSSVSTNTSESASTTKKGAQAKTSTND